MTIHQSPDAAIRRDQATFGQQRAGGSNYRNTTSTTKKFVAKGHDIQLQEAQFHRLPVVIGLMSGDTISGLIVRRDKWTVTVGGANHAHSVIVYKHAIETISIQGSAPSQETN